MAFSIFSSILALPVDGKCGDQIDTKWASCFTKTQETETGCPTDFPKKLTVKAGVCDTDQVCCLMQPKIKVKVRFIIAIISKT